MGRSSTLVLYRRVECALVLTTSYRRGLSGGYAPPVRYQTLASGGRSSGLFDASESPVPRLHRRPKYYQPGRVIIECVVTFPPDALCVTNGISRNRSSLYSLFAGKSIVPEDWQPNTTSVCLSVKRRHLNTEFTCQRRVSLVVNAESSRLVLYY